MQTIITNLVASIGSVNSVQMHINMCIALRRSFRGNDDAGAVLMIMDYLAQQLGHILNADDAIVFTTSIMNMDAGVVSVTL